MSSTFSPTLRIELIGDGDQSGIWGQTTNSNLGTLIEQAITGVQTITMLDATYTLSSYNGVADEARNAVLVVNGTLTQQRNIIAPLVEKTYTIKNSTTGGFSIQIVGSSGTGVVIPNGQTLSVYCDGLNFYTMLTGTSGNFTVTGNLNVTGTTTLTGALSGSTATFAGAISSVSPSFTGIPTAPTASAGTNTTQIATTAFVTSVINTLGTMSTQNANAVNITGGTLTGMTNVAGGTHSGTTATFSGLVTGSSFTGAGTGLTGTAAGLSIGGNAATVTNGVYNNGGTYSINITGNSGSSTLASKASTLAAGGGNGAAMTFNWSGLGGQPTWLWGGNDGTNMYVYNPSNFSVNYANSAGNANTVNNGVYNNGGTYSINITGGSGYATNAGNAYNLNGKSKLGLGITGEYWQDVTGSRAQDVVYYSPNYPIQVSGNFGCNGGGQGYIVINGVLIAFWQAQFNGCGGYSVNMPCIVPPNSSYYLTGMGGGARGWYELR